MSAAYHLARRAIDLEQAFNYRARLTQATDRLPRFFSDEPLPPHSERFDVQSEELAGIWAEDHRDI